MKLSFAGILRSEWIKLRSLRSTLWCYVIIVALTILLGLLFASANTSTSTDLPHDVQQSTWVTATTLGVNFAQLVVAVLGALVITGEYGTGMIRSTFAAVPQRIPAIVAKAIVFAVVTFVVTFVALVATAAIISPVLASSSKITTDFGDPQVWLCLVGAAGYLALMGLISLSIGLLLRNSAAGIAAALGLMLVVPVIFNLLAGLAQADWAADVGTFLPSNAGAKLFAYPVDAGVPLDGSGPDIVGSGIDLTSWQALLVVLGWFVVTFVAGLIVLKRRDA